MVRVPTEVVKQRSQTGSKGTRSWDVAKTVWRGEGLRGFYRGFGSTVAREVSLSLFSRLLSDGCFGGSSSAPFVNARTLMLSRIPQIPFTCLQFPLYERLKLLLTRRTLGHSAPVSDLPAWQAAACGSIAGGVAAGLTTPVDVAKTRIMLANQVSLRLSLRLERRLPIDCQYLTLSRWCRLPPILRHQPDARSPYSRRSVESTRARVPPPSLPVSSRVWCGSVWAERCSWECTRKPKRY
jgi:solute carrier family 25 S-adenosylmethionine transporter 26